MFCFFTHLKPWKIRILKKWKNLLEVSSFSTCVPKIKITWYTVPEIGSETDRVFCNFGPFFALIPASNPENQNFVKMKKAPGDVILLHMCTKTHDHTMYASWDMEYDRQNFLSLWIIFCPFSPIMTWKIKILKKWKKSLEMLLFYTCLP